LDGWKNNAKDGTQIGYQMIKLLTKKPCGAGNSRSSDRKFRIAHGQTGSGEQTACLRGSARAKTNAERGERLGAVLGVHGRAPGCCALANCSRPAARPPASRTGDEKRTAREEAENYEHEIEENRRLQGKELASLYGARTAPERRRC